MKFCNAPNCSNPVFGKGYCKNHQYMRPDFDNRSIVQRAMDKEKMKKNFGKLKNLPENMEMVAEKNDLEKWFDYVATIIKANPHCSNCGEFIPDMITKNGKLVSTSRFYRAASAHILPKAHFESVKTHPLNFLVLGSGCGCHDDTHRMDTFSKMKCFPEAVRRFRIFQPLVKEKHKLLDEFLRYADAL